VQVTPDLGIQYLWIDALYILQRRQELNHDEEAQRDWQYKSLHKHFIYRKALLAIVAAGASHCDGGLYIWKVSKRVQPIFSRGWTSQEWLLSHRLLIFTSQGPAVFSYNTNDKMRGGSALPDCTLEEFEDEAKVRLLHIGQKDSREKLATVWHDIAKNFSRRRLTNPGDKLPAISGVAQKVGSLLGFREQDYLAGLWRTNLLRDLLWTIRRRDESRSGQPDYVHPVRRPGRSPSGSWASMDGEIYYHCAHKNVEVLARAISCDTVPVPGGDHYGQLESGELVPGCCHYMRAVSCQKRTEDIYHLWAQDSILKCSLILDDGAEMERLGFSSQKDYRHEPQTATYCLGMYMIDRCGDIDGIVVCFDGKINAFVRIGSATFYKGDYYWSKDGKTLEKFRIK
jgi:hypothetical protein